MESAWNIKSLFTAGVSDHHSPSTNQKIALSNNIACFGLVLNAVYVPISLLVMPQYLPYDATNFLLFLIVPLLNNAGQHVAARYITATGSSFTIFFFHVGIISESEPPLIGLYLVQASLLILPWILFNTKERIHVISSFLTSALLILLVRPLNGMIEPDSRSREIILSQNMEYVLMVTAFSIFGICLYLLQQINSNAEKENDILIQEAEQKNAELNANEAKLNKYIEEIETTRVEDKKREWANNGLAKFADILRAQQDDIQKSYDAIISSLVKYLEANQGGLFVVEEAGQDKFLVLQSCYAYERKKFLNRRIEIGEGLVGQCYLEKDVVYLTEVPTNYVTITSGIGEAAPRSIILIPLLLNDEVFGIIELASFKPFEKYQIDFLEKVGENTASTISNLKTNQHTKLLLEESQQQSEEMRSQEEEMRQNMEELSATQEEMARKNKEMQDAMEEMKHKASLLDSAQIEISELKKKLVEHTN